MSSNSQKKLSSHKFKMGCTTLALTEPLALPQTGQRRELVSHFPRNTANAKDQQTLDVEKVIGSLCT